jgi:hypothetical protein
VRCAGNVLCTLEQEENSEETMLARYERLPQGRETDQRLRVADGRGGALVDERRLIGWRSIERGRGRLKTARPAPGHLSSGRHRGNG